MRNASAFRAGAYIRHNARNSRRRTGGSASSPIAMTDWSRSAGAASGAKYRHPWNGRVGPPNQRHQLSGIRDETGAFRLVVPLIFDDIQNTLACEHRSADHPAYDPPSSTSIPPSRKIACAMAQRRRGPHPFGLQGTNVVDIPHAHGEFGDMQHRRLDLRDSRVWVSSAIMPSSRAKRERCTPQWASRGGRPQGGRPQGGRPARAAREQETEETAMSDAVIGPLEERYRRSEAFRNASDQTRVTATHYHIAVANGLGWGFDGMDGVIFALATPLLIKEFGVTLSEWRSGPQIALLVGIIGIAIRN